MKYVKMLGLAAIAAAALTAFVGVGSASATEVTCSVGNRCPANQEIHAVTEKKAVLDAPFGNIECEGTVRGFLEMPGSASETATGPLDETIVGGEPTGLHWSNCGSDTVQTLKAGTLEVHTTETNNNHDGTLTSTGA